MKKEEIIPPAPKVPSRKVVVPIEKKGKGPGVEELREINITKEDLKRIKKKDKVKGGAKEIEFTIYKSSFYGRLANSFFENISHYLIKKYPEAFESLFSALKKSGIKILSETYVSIMLFSSFLALIGSFIGMTSILLITGSGIIDSLIKSIGISVLACISVFLFLYFYPSSVVKKRRIAIKNDLPFVIIHMAAVSGSGAQPISVFNLILDTGEYPGLEGEIKKIVNYVNLFGYDLTTALRIVAATTPSPEFRELLTGITATIESGGDLKDYLKGKAEDALTTYRLERKKYVETLATYSDIYTAVLIAAPLMLMLVLAIINILGGDIYGFDAKTLAMFGTFIGIPFLNIAFLLFINIIQPEV